MNKPQTLKGFRDFLPGAALKRQFVVEKIKEVFERFGFDPLETPALEYAEVLTGKYGDEADKLLYLFEDRGGRKVGLRYDQTVPTARVVAQYGSAGSPQALPLPFKRYQIQPVWRAENTQKGRYREFVQCDIDIFGQMADTTLADAEILACTYFTYKNIGFPTVVLYINDRKVLFDTLGKCNTTGNPAFTFSIIQSIDKLDKVGVEGVEKELINKGLTPENAASAVSTLNSATLPISLQSVIEEARSLGVPPEALQFKSTLARGLDYYTGMIFEVNVPEYGSSSCCGGGRYDKLVSQLSGVDMPAVGMAMGFDRTIEAAEALNLLPTTATKTMVLVTTSVQTLSENLSITSLLRDRGINAENYLDPTAKLEKQLRYADRKGIPYVIVQGLDEVAKKTVTFKNMATKVQERLTLEEAMKKLTLAGL